MYNDLDDRTTVGGIRGAGTLAPYSARQWDSSPPRLASSRSVPTSAVPCPTARAGYLFLAAFPCLIGLRFAVRRSESSAVGLLFGFGLLMGLATAPTCRLLRRRESPGALASGWGHSPLHDRTWDDGLCKPTRLVRDRPSLFLGALGTHYLRHCHDLRSDTQRLDHLLRCGTGDIRRSHHVRLPAPALCKRP